MEQKVYRGRCAVPGCAEGEALVTTGKISGWGAIDAQKGVFIDPRDKETYGKCFAGKILVFDGAKGASGWSMYFHNARLNGVGPAAMLYNVTTTKVALGAVVSRTPAVTGFDVNITGAIKNGDWVRVDADSGTVEVLPER